MASGRRARVRRITVAMLVGVAAMTSCGLPSAAPEVPPSTRAQSAAPMPTAPKARGPVRIVALGDSVTSGYHCHCTAFPELYAAALGTRRRVHAAATNLGVPGLTSGELLAELTGSTTADATMTRTVPGVVDRIRTVRDGAPTTTMLTGYWNVFEDGDVADKAFPDEGVSASVALTKEANAGIRNDALAENAIYVDPYPVFDGANSDKDPTGLLASDGDHPNAAGHAAIAHQLLADTPAF